MPDKPKLRKPPQVDPAAAQAFIDGASASKLSSEQASKRASEQKRVYGGFYLNSDTIERLALTRERLLKMGGKRVSVNKSAIVEAALSMALDDLEAQGNKSYLASKLVGGDDG